MCIRDRYQRRVRGHVGKGHGQRMSVCPLCGEECPTPLTRRAHMRVHEQLEPMPIADWSSYGRLTSNRFDSEDQRSHCLTASLIFALQNSSQNLVHSSKPRVWMLGTRMTNEARPDAIEQLQILPKLWPDTEWEIVMAGPEMRLSPGQLVTLGQHNNLAVYGFNGTGEDCLKVALEQPNLVVLFNSGIGTKLAPVMLSWLPTLSALLLHAIPMLFFCFNEKELHGEQQLMLDTFGGRPVPFRGGADSMESPFSVQESSVIVCGGEHSESEHHWARFTWVLAGEAHNAEGLESSLRDANELVRVEANQNADHDAIAWTKMVLYGPVVMQVPCLQLFEMTLGRREESEAWPQNVNEVMESCLKVLLERAGQRVDDTPVSQLRTFFITLSLIHISEPTRPY
eukprot:TRINITY_DN16659_c0_g1_i1.p1 TRINITY_DN16659_c0_g1~~TRINITY_DN16659_c0_g1_i1.p1  ORF type:complete len:398 (+),score=71.95 TRINITY_DN16659_c0_g1_i1:138-1331(+)